MDDTSSPEEKLLRLIRKKEENKEDQKSSDSKPKGPSRFANVLTTHVMAGIFSVLEKILFTAILAVLGYLFYYGYYIKKDIRNFMTENESQASQVEWKEVAVSQAKPFSHYATQFDKRDIFESPLYKKENEGGKVIAPASELTKNLKLVGIVLSDTAEAIIEDVQSKRTFFLHKGEKINTAVVDEILEGKVILIIDDQRVELTQ